MKIKILKSSGWYENNVGSEFEIYQYHIDDILRFGVTNYGWIFKHHCAITELPESFCVKKSDDVEKWNKYINWLNKTYGACFNGIYWSYYGVECYRVGNRDEPFGTEIHIDDMIKHIDFYSEPMVVESKQEFNFNRKDAEILFPELSVEIAYNLFKCLATGTDEDLHECIKISPSSEISKLEGSKSYYEGIIAIKNRFNNYINMSKEFDLTTDEGRLAYAEKHYPIGTTYKPLDCDGNVYTSRSEVNAAFKPRIWVTDASDNKGIEVSEVGLIYHEKTNRWAEIIKEEKNMETQKLSRQGLKEIHGVACPNWKDVLEHYGSRNPLEDYIELTQEEVDKMFNACTKEQLPIVSKYLNQIDGGINFDKISGTILISNAQELIAKRCFGEYEYKSFYLHREYNWEIRKDSQGELCLIPTKKK